jgi:D-alanyl-D-alanine carboxypeptidase (penicillin-binding protein 5/6)
MKKSNGTLIALLLIAVHAGLFFVLVGPSGERTMDTPPEKTPPPIVSTDLSSASQAVDPLVAEILSSSDAMPESVPVVTPSAGGIYTPSSEAGRLRNDQPARYSEQNYPSLVGDPYQCAIVVDAQTGDILVEDRAMAFGYPASVTKLMTLLVCLEAIDQGEIALSDRVKITEEVWHVGGSQLYLDPRETDLTVEDMLYGIMVHSANDAARALSLHVAGSRAAFVERMNRRAQLIGMSATRYVSDHGLPPEDQSQPDISTPYDIALLALACLRHPETLTYTGTELIYLREGDTMLATRNALAKRVDGYAGCDGLKTGYHKRGGFSLAATAERNGHRIISVVLGSPDKEIRNAVSRRLLDRGFDVLEARR